MTAVSLETADERRAAVVTGALVAAVVLILGVGSGIGAVLHRSSSPASVTRSSTPLGAGPDLGGDVAVDRAPSASLISHSHATTGVLSSADAAFAANYSDPVSAPAASTSSAAVPCSGTPMAAAMLDPFVVHLDHAHLQESPGQQANDLLNTDQYVKTHTVLAENMLAPLIDVALMTPSDLDPFVVHLDHAHLEESPGQQANDLLNVNQYVKTHTVLIENMAAPTLNGVSGSC